MTSINNRLTGTQPLGAAPVRRTGTVSDGAPEATDRARDSFQGSGRLDGVSRATEGSNPVGSVAARMLKDKIVELKNMSPAERMRAGAKVSAGGVGLYAELTGNKDLADLASGIQASQDGIGKGRRLIESSKAARDAFRETGSLKALGEPFKPPTGTVEPLSKFGKAAAGVDVVRGAVAGVDLVRKLSRAAHDPKALTDPKVIREVGGDALEVLNGVGAAAKIAGRTGVLSKLNPITGIASGGIGVFAASADMAKNGLNWKNGSDLVSQGLNLAGNIAMVIPGGQAIGGALKLTALGVDLVRYGIANKDKILSAGKAAVRLGGQVAKKTGEFFQNPAKVAGELRAAAAQDMKAIGNKAVDAVKGVGSAVKDGVGSFTKGLKSFFGG